VKNEVLQGRVQMRRNMTVPLASQFRIFGEDENDYGIGRFRTEEGKKKEEIQQEHTSWRKGCGREV